jgi:fatty-acyl-CoA synthase
LAEVGEAAIVGVPDARWGEAGRAYIVPAPGREITADLVIGHCLARLAKFKVPSTVIITDTVPRTASGKVQKHLLLARALAEMAENAH